MTLNYSLPIPLVMLLTYFGTILPTIAAPTTLTVPSAGYDSSRNIIITSHPQSQLVSIGAVADLQVQATGSFLSYQWLRNGVPVVGATSSKFSFAPSMEDSSVSYSVVVKSGARNVQSLPALITVTDVTGPIITVQPSDISASPETSIKFSVKAQPSDGLANQTLRYQWKRNGVKVLGADSLDYSFVAHNADNGARYSVLISDGTNSVESRAALLTVSVDPTLEGITCTGAGPQACNPINSMARMLRVKNFRSDPTPVRIGDSSSPLGYVEFSVLPEDQRRFYDPTHSVPYPNNFLAVSPTQVSGLAGCWDDVFASMDEGHSGLTGPWWSASPSLLSYLPNQLVKSTYIRLFANTTPTLGINFSSRSTSNSGHQLANSSTFVAVNESYGYFMNHVMAFPSYRSFSEVRPDRTVDLYDGLYSHTFNSLGRSNSEEVGIKKLAIAGCALPENTKRILKRTGNFASALLYIYKATLPYADSYGVEVPYHNELRHRVTYLSGGSYVPPEEYYYIGSNQSYHRYSDALHLYKMVQLAQSMQFTPPVAVLTFKSFSVKRNGEYVVRDATTDTSRTWLKRSHATQIQFWGNQDEEIEVKVDLSNSYDLMGRPLRYHVKSLYSDERPATYVYDMPYNRPLSDLTLVLNAGGGPTRRKIPFLIYVDNGIYESNPVFVNLFVKADGQVEIPPYVDELNPDPRYDLTVNLRPSIVTGSIPTAVAVGDTLQFSIACSDPDGNKTILYRWLNEPGRLENNVFTLPITPDMQGTNSTLHFICSDHTGAFGSKEVPVTVLAGP